MTKVMVIANPKAGHGNGARAIPQIRNEFSNLGLDYRLIQTEFAGHGIQLAHTAAMEGSEIIVAAGGDGTINEVLNGMMDARQIGDCRPALGILCTGRGNDFAPSLNIPKDLHAACRILKNNHHRQIDVGHVIGGNFPQGRYFVNTVGVGFDAIGTIEVAKLPEWGMLSYLLAILKTIFLYYRGPTVRLDYDRKSLTTSTLMLLTMNGIRMGTGFKMAPEARLDDGMFDLVVVRQVSRLRIFSLVPHFIKGTQASQPEVQTLRASRVAVSALTGVLPAQSDGEIICVDGARLDITLLPRQLEVICPEE
jgi:diacylglycerol kinase (ATP)